MDTGIISYGVALPKHRLAAEDIYQVWKNVAHDLLDKLSIGERGVTGPEEDTVTLAAAAGKMALERGGIPPEKIGALLLGTGTSPYATKAAASILVDALGLPAHLLVTDVQCAEKSGSTALLMAASLVEAATLLTHGDLLCTDDVDYQQARVMLRSPAFVADFLGKPLAARAALAAEYRRRSGEAPSLKAEDIMDVNADAVVQAMRAHGVRRLIHGHTHRPAIHSITLDGQAAERVVLAEWHHDAGQCVCVTAAGVKVEAVK